MLYTVNMLLADPFQIIQKCKHVWEVHEMHLCVYFRGGWGSLSVANVIFL